MVGRRVEVVGRLKESVAPLISFPQNPALVQELRADNSGSVPGTRLDQSRLRLSINMQSSSLSAETTRVLLPICTAHFAQTVIAALVPCALSLLARS